MERLRNIPRPAEHVPRLRLPRFESNDASVVISIQIGQRELILLGADLEERGLAEVGWQGCRGRMAGWPRQARRFQGGSSRIIQRLFGRGLGPST